MNKITLGALALFALFASVGSAEAQSCSGQFVGSTVCGNLSGAVALPRPVAVGTAITANTGTSGHVLPFLDGANTFSALNKFVQTGSTVELGAPNAHMLQIVEGSDSVPIATDAPTVLISRHDSLTTQGSWNEALHVIAVGGTAAGGGAGGQPIAITGQAYQIGTGDVVGTQGKAVNQGHGLGAAIGGFFEGVASSTNSTLTSAQGLGVQFTNATGTDVAYNTTALAQNMTGIDIAYSGSAGLNKGGAFIAMRAGASNGKPTVGIGFWPSAALTASIRDDSTAVQTLLDNGSHTYFADLNAGTYSGAPIRFPNNAGIVSRNAANNADVALIKLNASNAVVIGAITYPSTTGTSGGVLYFSSTTAIASSALLTANQIVLGGGAGAAPATLGSLGTTTTVLHGNASGAPTFGAIVSADLNITTTTCTNQFVSAISATGTATCTTDTLASAQHANQGTTTTLLHGNGAGNPSFGAVVSADLNITTTSCTNQFITAISAGGVGTCTTDTLTSAQHANQGTTTTVLHGNAAGNPSFGSVSLTTDASGTLQAAQEPAHTGDVTNSAGSLAMTLATVNSNVGTFGSATAASQVTVNGKGLVTAASSVTITPAVGSITGLGTGVATALAVNIGTAGSFVVNGGALGSPSSAGTLPALTLGGTITGGSQQINSLGNVGIGRTPTVPFDVITASAVGQQAASSLGGPDAATAEFVKMFTGSSGSPITTSKPSIAFSKYSQQTVLSGQGANNSVLLLTHVGNDIGPGNPQVNVLTVSAEQNGSGDAAPFVALAIQNGSSRAALAGFFSAAATASGGNVVTIQTNTANNTGVNGVVDLATVGNNTMVGFDAPYSSTGGKTGGAAFLVRGLWGAGYVVMNGTATTPFASQGFSVDGSGNVTTKKVTSIAGSGFNPGANVLGAYTLSGDFGGGIVWSDTAYIGMWASGSGTVLHMKTGGTSGGWGTSTGDLVLNTTTLTSNVDFVVGAGGGKFTVAASSGNTVAAGTLVAVGAASFGSSSTPGYNLTITSRQTTAADGAAIAINNFFIANDTKIFGGAYTDTMAFYNSGAAGGFKFYSFASATSSLTITDGAVLMPRLASSGTISGAICHDSSNQLITQAAATCVISSARFKEDISPFTHGLDWVMASQPKQFNYKADYYGGMRSFNIMAEDAAAISPMLVTLDSEGKPYGVRDELLPVIAFNAIKELKADNDNLRQEIEELRRANRR